MVLKFKGEIMKKSYLIIAILLLLTSCTIKNAEYTFNQGAPDCAQNLQVTRPGQDRQTAAAQGTRSLSLRKPTRTPTQTLMQVV